MAGLIPEEEALAIREELAVLLVHTYTRTPVTEGAEDGRYEGTDVPGVPISGVACRYEAQSRIGFERGDANVVYRPTLTVAATDPTKPGDAVSAILNAAGGVVAAGPFACGRRTDDDPLGYTLLRTYELLGAETLGGVA